jgi:hypothetical protein
MNPTLYDDDLWNPGPGPIGAAHCVSNDWPEQNSVERLHAIIFEITGIQVVPPERKIGFY